MAGILQWLGANKLSWLLIAGVVAAIWYVMDHRDKLMLDKSPPPKE
ncbi:hypothetical protein [Gorillibacterium sp. sgz5001074]